MAHEWHYVRYTHEMELEGNLPPDERFYEWRDSYGNIEIARFKFDIFDHFFPPTELIKEPYIVAWRDHREEDGL